MRRPEVRPRAEDSGAARATRLGAATIGPGGRIGASSCSGPVIAARATVAHRVVGRIRIGVRGRTGARRIVARTGSVARIRTGVRETTAARRIADRTRIATPGQHVRRTGIVPIGRSVGRIRIGPRGTTAVRRIVGPTRIATPGRSVGRLRIGPRGTTAVRGMIVGSRITGPPMTASAGTTGDRVATATVERVNAPPIVRPARGVETVTEPTSEPI